MARQAKIHPIERKGRKNKYGISYPRPGQTPRRVFHWENAKDRDAQLKRDLRIAASQGNDVFQVSAADVQLMKELREILPSGVDPREAARAYVANLGPSIELTLGEAIREHLHSLEIRELSPEHHDHVDRALGSLQSVLGSDMRVGDIETRNLELFLASLPYARRTKANVHQYLTTFFKWAAARGCCARSPMEGIGKIKVPETDPHPLPVGDVRKFFESCVAVNAKAAPYFALSFFAGFRSSQLRRIVREDIKFGDRGIRLPGSGHKTSKRFYVHGFDDNLWAWLEPWEKMDALPYVGKSTIIKWRQIVYTHAQIEYPHNGGRDSFCSYHIAKYNNASLTATLLTHRSVGMQYRHYLGEVEKRDGVPYFKIVPPDDYLDRFAESMALRRGRPLKKI